MRMAGARLLAELPTVAIDERMIQQLVSALDHLTDGGTVGQFVGPEFEGQRMLMQLRPGAPFVDAEAYEGLERGSVPARVVPQQVEQMVSDPPARGREVVFGWSDAGWNPNSPRPLRYEQDETVPAEIRQQVRMQLPQAQQALIERAGLQAGDLLINSPYGINKEDYGRAKAYIRSGYGAASEQGDQLARIGRGGILQPEQITRMHRGLARELGWRRG
jgi:hypothetical protein